MKDLGGWIVQDVRQHRRAVGELGEAHAVLEGVKRLFGKIRRTQDRLELAQHASLPARACGRHRFGGSAPRWVATSCLFRQLLVSSYATTRSLRNAAIA